MEKQTNNNKRQFLGIWIPREIYLNTDLSWTDKILLVEINSLDNERGCFASNDYFAEFLGVTTTTISTSVSKLKKLGFIKQVSFDGRTRILKAEFKQSERLPTRKLKGGIQENLKHNNTLNKTTNNSLKKEKIYKKDLEVELKDKDKLLTNDPMVNAKVKKIISSSTCIEVKKLKGEQIWLEHVTRHLKLGMQFTHELLDEFISEQELKDDAFKSIHDTKNHFLNWAKLKVEKNRKFGNEQWGQPNFKMRKQNEQPRDTYVAPIVSDKEKKEMHQRFMKKQLVDPYKIFLKTGQTNHIQNFGGIVLKEIKKAGFVFEDKKIIEDIQHRIDKSKERVAKRGVIAESINEFSGSNIDVEIVKLSFQKMKDQKVNVESIFLK